MPNLEIESNKIVVIKLSLLVILCNLTPSFITLYGKASALTLPFSQNKEQKEYEIPILNSFEIETGYILILRHIPIPSVFDLPFQDISCYPVCIKYQILSPQTINKFLQRSLIGVRHVELFYLIHKNIMGEPISEIFRKTFAQMF